MPRRTARTILMLQGPPSGFWRQLAKSFQAAGARVVKAHVCAADVVYWGGTGCERVALFRGARNDWPAWIKQLMAEESVTDVLYFADRQPYHAAAAQVAEELCIRYYAIEFGYLRPGWLTLERGGMGAWSHFPSDPHIVRALGRAAPALDMGKNHLHGFAHEAFNEVTFNLVNTFDWLAFPRYDADRMYAALPEYLSTFLRTARRWRNSTRCRSALASIGAWPYVLHPLQLQNDWQLRANSPWKDQRDVLDQVMASMARAAPPEMRLVIKLHPMDVGMINWGAETARISARHGLEGRVHFIDGGDLAQLINGAHCLTMVNSTVGIHAIRSGKPVKTFGVAIYDMPGLTHQGELDVIWTGPEPVDQALADGFVRLLAQTIQLKGSFYETEGRALAVTTVINRIMNEEVNEPGAFIDPPPRAMALHSVPSA